MSDENKDVVQEELDAPKKKKFKKPEVRFVWWKELMLLPPVVIFVWLYLGSDPASFNGLITSLAITTLAVYFGHVIKGLIIPEFSLLQLYHKAREEALASAIVIAAVLYFLVQIIQLAQIR